MNQSEINNLATLIVAVAGPMLAKYTDAATLTTALGDITSLAAIGWGVYSHWNKIKVPETRGASK